MASQEGGVGDSDSSSAPPVTSPLASEAMTVMRKNRKSLSSRFDAGECATCPTWTAEDELKLHDGSKSVLPLVYEWRDKYHEFQEANVALTDPERVQWNQDFLKVDDDVLFNLILTANSLEIKPLLDLTCKQVAEYIKACKSAEEIRTRFNIVNDFTPEEEEEVKRENAWCDEIP